VKFCFPTTFYPPESFGGDAIAVQRLARALVRRGHNVTVVHDADAYAALHHGPDPVAERIDDGVEVITLKSWARHLSPLVTQQTARPVFNAARLREILGDPSFDVINYHNVSLIGGPRLFSYGRAAKMYTAHEHWLVCPTHVLWRFNREICDARKCVRCQLAFHRPPQLWRMGHVLEKSLDHIQIFIALSEFSRAKHREFGFPREMEVLPQFAPDSVTHEDHDSPRPHERPYFLCVGRLEPVKGIHDAVDAFASYHDADLLIAGEGNSESSLRAAARDNPRCVFLGRLDPDDLRRYYRHALATVVPSVGYETFGMVLMESFREGTPVIARRVGPFPEAITSSGGGELFGTREELIASLGRKQGDRAYAEALGRAGKIAFSERWTEDRVIPAYVALAERAREMKS
jgi:glycosyltransferase involved in cell wall biosynthesis